MTQKTILLFSEDADLYAMVYGLPEYQVQLPDASAWQDQFFDLVMLDISAWDVTEPLLNHLPLVTNYLIVVAALEDQDHLHNYESAHDYLLKPLNLPRLRKCLASIERHTQEVARYLSHIRHELKNPLASITGYTDLLLGALEDPAVAANVGELTEKQVRFLESIRRSAKKMQQKIDEFSDGEQRRQHRSS